MSRFIQIFLSTFSLFAAVALTAQEAERDKLQATIESALDVIYSDCGTELNLEAKEAKVRETIESNYNLDVIIRRAIGRNWRRMKEAEQQQVLELVKQLVVKAYVQGMDGKDRPVVELGEITQVKDTRVDIESTVTLDDKKYFVLYRLAEMSTGWEIYDIVAENISVVSNYREQIDDHFRKGTSAGLIARLEEL